MVDPLAGIRGNTFGTSCSAGAVAITSTAKATTCCGAVGNDILDGGAGLNTILGESGVDTVSYLGAEGPLELTLEDGYGYTVDRYDTLSDTENVETTHVAAPARARSAPRRPCPRLRLRAAPGSAPPR